MVEYNKLVLERYPMKAFVLMGSSCSTDNDAITVIIDESMDAALGQLNCSTPEELNSSELLKYLKPSKDHKLSLKEVPIINSAIHPIFR